MKKKGLIISTVVMAVVLIASLTTATYAWFSQTAAVSVSPMLMTSEAATGLKIGAKANAYTDETGYVYGDSLEFANGYWGANGSGIAGLGANVSIIDTIAFSGINNATTKATSAGTDANGVEYAIGDFITAKTYISSEDEGYDPNNPAPATYTKSVANEDYIDLNLGIAATSADIDQIYYTITVTFAMEDITSFPESMKPGMAAAIHFSISLNGGAATEVQAFDGYTLSSSMNKASSGTFKGTVDETLWTWTYSGFIYNTNGEPIEASAIQTMQIYAWIEGTDDACRTSTAGTGATIRIDFAHKTTSETEVTITNGVLA